MLRVAVSDIHSIETMPGEKTRQQGVACRQGIARSVAATAA
ncbi:hypothetical protein OW565_04930 [Acidithiobacillus ferriphilus]|nr:hypothetical protein [Acidithiobacillus ferriphilus]